MTTATSIKKTFTGTLAECIGNARRNASTEARRVSQYPARTRRTGKPARRTFSLN
jgi:hypothetical protein